MIKFDFYLYVFFYNWVDSIKVICITIITNTRTNARIRTKTYTHTRLKSALWSGEFVQKWLRYTYLFPHLLIILGLCVAVSLLLLGFFFLCPNQFFFFLSSCVSDTLVKDSKWQLCVCVRICCVWDISIAGRDDTQIHNNIDHIWLAPLMLMNNMSMYSMYSTIERIVLWIPNCVGHQNQDLKIEVTSS